jgi:cytoskeletal protein CcmA (bactofilin family)
MAGYIRQSSFVDGDTITAALFNNEYNQILSAFSNTSGHAHDGTAAEGPVIGLIGDAGETAPNNKVLIDTTNNYIEFYVQVSSSPVQQLYIADGAIVPVTDSDVDLGTSSLYFKDAYIDSITTTGNVGIGGNLTVTGTTTFNGGTITMGDAATDNVVFGADIDSNIIPDDDNTYDLGSSGQEWRNLYIDGIANIDSLVADTADINGGTVDGAIIGGSSAAAITGTTITGTSFVIGSADISEAELETIDGITAGTVAASKAIVVDSNKDFTGARNITLTGELDAGSLDVSGDVDVDGTTNLDVVDIDGAVDMATTLTVAGNVDFNGDLDVDGTTNLDVVDIDGAVDMATTLTVGGEITAASLDISGNVDIDGTLETDALSINSTTVTSTAAELNILDGVTASATDINLIDGITNGTVIASKAIITDANKDITGGRNITITGELDAATLDISGDADIDGTLETDALSINGTAVTSTAAELNILDGVTSTAAELNILDGVTSTAAELNILDGVTSTAAELNILDGVTASAADINLIDGITNGTVIASKAIITDSNKDISGGRNITISGELDAATLDISGDADIDGTLEADAITVNGTALASVIAGTTVDNATTAAVATTVTITDNENTNENNAIIFTAGGDLDGGNLGLESDGDLKYNPSTGTLSVPNVSVSGTFSTVNSVTMDANNAVIFEGATADAHETTLTSIDATADRTISLPNVSGTIPVLAAASTTQITSTPEELNILDGVTSTAAELNILDGVTSTAAELNILDGVTSTAAELNILDGVTSTAAELNVLDGITAVVGELNALDIGATAIGTAVASKAVILDSNKDYTGIRNLTITGELDAATLDISGNVDIDGTLETDNLTVGGAQGSDGQVLTSTGSGVAWEDAASGGASNVNGLSDAKTFGTASIMIGDATTGTIDAANYNTGLGIDVFAALTSGDYNTTVG